MAKSQTTLACLVLFYILIFGVAASLRHYDFQTQTWDLGIFTQIIWNISRGAGPVGTLEFVSHHFAVHMSPILFLLTPGYWLFPSPYYLLIIQTLALALGAWPLYLLALRILKNTKFATIIAASYLLYPSLHWVNWYDFHPIAFLIPSFMAAFYFAETKNWKWFAVFAALAASAQEDAILIVAFLGIYLSIKDVGRPWDVRRLKIGLLLFLLSVLYFLLSIKFIMPYFGGGLLRLDRYAYLGAGFGEIFKNLFLEPQLFLQTVFTWQKFTYLFWLFLPVAFLPFAAWGEFMLLLPGLAQNLLTLYQPQFSGSFQYDSALISGIFIATVFAIKKFPKAIWALAMASLLVFFIKSPVSPLNFPTELFHKNSHWETLRQISKQIPPEASVAAHTNLVPHLANREKIYMLGYEPEFEPDILLIDGADYFGFGTPEAFEKYAQKYADSGLYNAQIIADRYYVLIKKK